MLNFLIGDCISLKLEQYRIKHASRGLSAVAEILVSFIFTFLLSFLAKRCNFFAKFGYCYYMLSVVCLTRVYCGKTTEARITRFY